MPTRQVLAKNGSQSLMLLARPRFSLTPIPVSSTGQAPVAPAGRLAAKVRNEAGLPANL